jgi:ribonuclease HI
VYRNKSENSSVECAGVLSALLDADADQGIWIFTDNLASVQTMHKLGDWRGHWANNIPSGTVSHRRRIRSGARAYITTTREVIAARQSMGAFTRISWVWVHMGRGDTHSRANDMADRLANNARRMGADKPDPFTFNDERMLLFTLLHGDHGPPNYVSGGIRGTLERNAGRLVNSALCQKQNSVQKIVPLSGAVAACMHANRCVVAAYTHPK